MMQDMSKGRRVFADLRMGQGSWGLAENLQRRKDEIRMLQLGIDLGLTLIDTAEMYADGGAEELIGEAIRGRRDEVFLVSKVYPHNASRRGTITACDQSLRRLGTERIDLYLLHWRGSVPLQETVAAFEELIAGGKIGAWGVSNFDVRDLEELWKVPGGDACATDQVLYNLTRRGPEFDLLPWTQSRQVPVMAYSPIEQGRVLREPVLHEIARRHGVSSAQVALAWTLRQDGVVPIPKASTEKHVRDNHAALDLILTEEDLIALDREFSPPTRKQRLEML